MRSIKWIIIALVIIAIPVVQFVRPLPHLTVQAEGATVQTLPGSAPHLDWPQEGQAALTAVGIGDMGQSGAQTPTPIASVTKVMTAYLVLKKHPLGVGQDGPTITVTNEDYKTYLDDKSKGQSVLAVKAGEKLTERQALEGLMLPSGNNVATLLANWSDGSVDKFVQDMNSTAKAMGMTHTTYADASGYLPASASTAVDQVKVFSAAMQMDAFKTIVGEAQAQLPVAGLVYNVDARLGHGGIIGGKTGSTSQAGGCFVFASQKQVGGKNVLLVGAVLGQTKGPSELMTALDEGVKLSQEAQATVRQVHVVTADQPVATVQAPWASAQVLHAGKAVDMIGWPGMQVHKVVAPAKNVKSHVNAGETVATLTVSVGNQKQTIPLKTVTAISGPSYTWRLKRL
ncbi:D-alanyl-D-alanine carboxypeptidase family protein [Alicyclobacillus dauci]|uniref:D-alanyl-D-alanine carboxypeptidase n=1 Tax=Alicyclobacillus dauci TaxID=1475485 RepID=A0ABY6Z339_9BACL|nr:D-alanyl-D-alanine carboxypeptidase [Alicyclobacillus dauci]WAH36704.1 D-alanyl-D-alanine carboxypeptidase [Alicyclobacillus dauci]